MIWINEHKIPLSIYHVYDCEINNTKQKQYINKAKTIMDSIQKNKV